MKTPQLNTIQKEHHRYLLSSQVCVFFFFLLLPLCATAIVIDHYRQRQQRYALRFYIVPTAMGVLESIVAVASSRTPAFTSSKRGTNEAFSVMVLLVVSYSITVKADELIQLSEGSFSVQ